MQGKRLGLSLLLFLVQASPAAAMLRVLKYQSLTEVSDRKICVYAQHEMNPKRENHGHPQNTREPIVCRLSIKAEARGPGGKKTVLEGETIERFAFETLQKSCADYSASLPKGFKVEKFSGLSTECATGEAGPRVFPAFARAEAKQIKK